jgi:pilus assembly protein CpaE
MASVIVVTEREDYVQWLMEALDKERELVVADQDTVERVLQLIDATQAGLVFVQLGGGEKRSHTALIEGLLAAKPFLSVVAVSDSQDHGLLLSAMRAGARDFLRVGSPPREVQALVHRLEEKSPKDAAAPASHGQIFAFLSARPYEGITTLAVHTAIALLQPQEPEQNHDQRVLLLDLGMPPADSLLTLGLKSTYTFIDAIRSVRRFDHTLIRTAFTRHKSGLTLLSLPDDLKELEGVTSADVMILLNILRSYFRHIIIHLGGVTPSDFVRLILSKSDQVFLVVEQSVPSCHAGKHLLDFLGARDYPTGSIGLIVDRYAPEIGLEAQDVAEVLGLPLKHTLPPSGMVRIKALNAGRSIFEVAPGDPYSRAVHALAGKLSDRAAPADTKPGWLGQWLGWAR